MARECGLATVELASGLLTRLGFLDAPREIYDRVLVDGANAWWAATHGSWQRFVTDFELWPSADDRYVYVCPLAAWEELKAQALFAGGPILAPRPANGPPPPTPELPPGIPPVAIQPLGPPRGPSRAWLWTLGLGLSLVGTAIWIGRRG